MKYITPRITPSSLMLSRDAASWALSVVESRPYDCSGPGGAWGIWLEGDKAIKSPATAQCLNSPSPFPSRYSLCVRECSIGRALTEDGVNVPKMFGVSSAGDCERPLLLMERLNLDYNLSRDERALAARKWASQIVLAEDSGYIVLDNTFLHNSGYDRSKQEVFLFDFENWRVSLDKLLSLPEDLQAGIRDAHTR